jgi:hypothetical protein
LDKEIEYIGSNGFSRDLGRMKLAEMSPEDKRKSVYGDKKQGDKLVKKKFATPSYHAKQYKATSMRS